MLLYLITILKTEDTTINNEIKEATPEIDEVPAINSNIDDNKEPAINNNTEDNKEKEPVNNNNNDNNNKEPVSKKNY